jgi:sulfopyruvate decarboxylase TPP-binding subunit
MKQAEAGQVIAALKEAGFDFAVTLPATQIHTLQEQLSHDPDFTHVAVTNEAEGCAIAAGAWLAGKMPVIVMETSGILVSSYPLLRVHATFGIPLLMLSTYRGGLGEQEWYAVHTGAALPALLGALRIASHVVGDVAEAAVVIKEARQSMDASLHPISVVFSGRVTGPE